MASVAKEHSVDDYARPTPLSNVTAQTYFRMEGVTEAYTEVTRRSLTAATQVPPTIVAEVLH